MAGNWQFLSCIFNSLGRLDHPLYQPLAHDDYPREYRLLALESALESNLRSGKTPMRGRRVTALGLLPSERIEMKIDVETAIDIPRDEITLCKVYPEVPAAIEIAAFKQVQADMASVEQWLRENILPAGGDARGKSSPVRNRAQRVIDELYPSGVPAPASLSNATLCRKVGAKLKETKMQEVSDDTILRAAGRRK